MDRNELSFRLRMATQLGEDYRRVFMGREVRELINELANSSDDSLVLRMIMLGLGQVCTQNGRLQSVEETKTPEELSEKERMFLSDGDGDGIIIDTSKNSEFQWQVEESYPKLDEHGNPEIDEHGNEVKETRSIKNTPYTDIMSSLGFYKGDKSGLPWCDSFTDFLFLFSTLDVDRFGELTGQFGSRKHGSSSNYSMRYFQSIGAILPEDEEPMMGDQIFFWDGPQQTSVTHTGIVVAVDGDYIYTIEGNTLADYSVEHNGSQSDKSDETQADIEDETKHDLSKEEIEEKADIEDGTQPVKSDDLITMLNDAIEADLESKKR